MKRAASFKKVVLCHTNDFKPSVNDKIKGWVESNGGTFVKDLTPNVTHLVASRVAWKKYHPLVKQARRMRTVRIVQFDWLEDSLLRRPVRALPEDKYLYEQVKLKPARKAKSSDQRRTDETGSPKKIVVPKDKRIEVTGIEFDNAIKEFEQDMGIAGFHPYSDKTGFVYIVTLLRYDILKSRFEKHKLKVGSSPSPLSRAVIPGVFSTPLYLFPRPEPFSSSLVTALHLPRRFKSHSRIHVAEPWAQCLQLFESDTQPHTYACYIQYTRPGTQKQVSTLAPPGSTWSFTWDIFIKCFLTKVGVSWDRRPANGSEIKVDDRTEVMDFQYVTPKIGEPEGLREEVNSDTLPHLARCDEATAVVLLTDENADSVDKRPDSSGSGATLIDCNDGHLEDAHHP